jgi:predicted membrane metal-binding protein
MGWRGFLTVLALFLWGFGAAAQTLPWPNAPAAQPGMAAPSGAEQAVCTIELTQLSQDVENLRAAARAATERKAKRREICKYLTEMAQAATKLIHFAGASGSACGLAPGAMAQIRGDGERAIGACRQICILEPVAGRLDDVPPAFATPVGLANSNCGGL